MKKEYDVFRVSDGLGNQLFQYACAYSVHRKTGKDVRLDPMYSGHLRCYLLEEFQTELTGRFVNKELDCILGGGSRNAVPVKLWYRNKKINKEHLAVVREVEPVVYDNSIYTAKENRYFIGFWQSYQYFDAYYSDLKQQFKLKKKLGGRCTLYAKQMQESQSVSLHIRRSDYIREKNNVCIKEDFYKTALNRIQRKAGDYKLFIFTDDKEYVRQNFRLRRYELIEGVSDLEEFILMQFCRHHILANSTFSWWGAYLAKDKGGIVYAPVAGMWTEDFYLPSWNCLKTDFGSTV